jgi:hypothetical protein
MSFFAHNRTLVIVGVGVTLALAGWWFLAPEPAPTSLLVTEAADSPAVDRGLVDTLLMLRAVSLSGTIFSEPAFATLQDFGTEIIPEPVGRPDPFAPISQRATSTARTPSFRR